MVEVLENLGSAMPYKSGRSVMDSDIRRATKHHEHCPSETVPPPNPHTIHRRPRIQQWQTARGANELRCLSGTILSASREPQSGDSASTAANLAFRCFGTETTPLESQAAETDNHFVPKPSRKVTWLSRSQSPEIITHASEVALPLNKINDCDEYTTRSSYDRVQRPIRAERRLIDSGTPSQSLMESSFSSSSSESTSSAAKLGFMKCSGQRQFQGPSIRPKATSSQMSIEPSLDSSSRILINRKTIASPTVYPENIKYHRELQSCTIGAGRARCSSAATSRLTTRQHEMLTQNLKVDKSDLHNVSPSTQLRSTIMKAITERRAQSESKRNPRNTQRSLPEPSEHKKIHETPEVKPDKKLGVLQSSSQFQNQRQLSPSVPTTEQRSNSNSLGRHRIVQKNDRHSIKNNPTPLTVHSWTMPNSNLSDFRSSACNVNQTDDGSLTRVRPWQAYTDRTQADLASLPQRQRYISHDKPNRGIKQRGQTTFQRRLPLARSPANVIPVGTMSLESVSRCHSSIHTPQNPGKGMYSSTNISENGVHQLQGNLTRRITQESTQRVCNIESPRAITTLLATTLAPTGTSLGLRRNYSSTVSLTGVLLMHRNVSLIVHTCICIQDLSDEHRQCMICLEDFTDREVLRWLPCLHNFHCSCIDTWLKGACPICKLDVVEAQKASSMRGDSCRGRSDFQHHDGTRHNARQYRAGRCLSADHFTPTANIRCESRRLLTLRSSIGWSRGLDSPLR